MKKTALMIIAMLLLAGCQSEQEKIHAKQVETCKEAIQSGQEPTQFCLALLPEYRAIASQQQVAQQPQAQQQYYPDQQSSQQPQVVYQQAPQPQIIQQAPQGNGVTDMLVGGLIGHALAGGNGGGSNNHYYSSQPAPRVTNNVTRNVTVIQRPKTPAPPKTNYMDTSKFGSASAKSSSMNIGRLSTSGKR